MSREVWIAEEATLTFWTMNSDGTWITPAALEDLYSQNISAKPIRMSKMNQQPGVGYEEPRSRVIGHEIRIGTLYAQALTQITPFLSTNQWRVLIQFINPNYDGVSLNQEQDNQDYRFCEVTEGPDWSYDDNNVAKTQLTLRAQFKA